MSVTNKKNISAIIPNYNGKNLLSECVPPLLTALNNSGIEYEIIIADDASSDGSVDYIKQNFPQIKIAEGLVNSGFSANINRGIALASKELCFLMNNDIIVEPDYFNNLFAYFEYPTTFGVMGRIMGYKDNIVQDTAKFAAKNGVQINGTVNYLKNEEITPTMLPTLFLSGANALIKTDKLKILNGFDEIFSPFYGEDLDLGIRAWRHGWKCWYEHSAICRHKTSSTIKNTNSVKRIKTIAARNKFILHYIHLDGKDRFLWFLTIFISFLIKLLTFDFTYHKGFFQFLSIKNLAKISRNKMFHTIPLNKVYTQFKKFA